MVMDKWLTAIGLATQKVFWAVGYFFGFTLVAALSCGLILPGAFPEIGRGGHDVWQVVYRRDGKFYLVAEAVAIVGWLFLSMVNWLVFWWKVHPGV